MISAKNTLVVASVFSILISLSSFRFLALGLPLSFPEMLGQVEGQRLAFLLHITFASVALAVGSVQFFASIRKRKALHRWLGRIYGVAIFIAGIAGVFIALNAAGGLSAQLGFFILSVLWVLVTANAVRHAIKRRIGLHRRWMIYSFALTFAGVTLRLYLLGFVLAGFTYTEASIYLAWMCWVPNLGFAWWWLHR